MKSLQPPSRFSCSHSAFIACLINNKTQFRRLRFSLPDETNLQPKMLRHLKMELKRRQETSQQPQQQQQQIFTGIDQQQQPQQHLQQVSSHTIAKPAGKVLANKPSQKSDELGQRQQAQKRVRGRRSSKPMMEKRRRARINQCLDILKSYVLTDSTNLSQLGIDATTRENQDEETIARNILKSSGLINRHRGRKNPNKLEKADILELTVDYVRRLHQRLVSSSNTNTVNDPINRQSQQPTSCSMSSPLTLDLSPVDNHKPAKHIALKPAGAPPSPPPSSASSSPQPLLSISSKTNQQVVAQTMLNQTNDSGLADILDLSDCRRKTSSERETIAQSSGPIYRDNMIFIEGIDGCWRPAWNPAVLAASELK